ncbi:MAG: proline racemase family protein [Cyclobacteriaceae bacterium]
MNMSQFFSANNVNPRSETIRVRTIDMHTGGEPLRIILEGFPEPVGDSVIAYRRFFMENYDHLRTSLMHEPRGHADMYGVIVTPSKVADFGVVFMHNEGYSTMCGHATIAITKLAVEAGWVEMVDSETRVLIEAPCGVLTAYAKIKDRKVVSVRFHNVPSFVVALDQLGEVPEIGIVNYDLAYGGAYYAFVNADELKIPLVPSNYQQLISTGMAIKHAVMESTDLIKHPEEDDLSFLYGTIFIGGPISAGVDSRNVCVFAEGEVDRCPTGSGVSARMAIHHQRQELHEGEEMIIESILGTQFTSKVHKKMTYAGVDAVIPEVEGTAYYTGQHEFWIDPGDPLHRGFIFR